jgi:hypothetical protein
VGFELTIPVFELAKTVHALDRAATVIGFTVGALEGKWEQKHYFSVDDSLTQSWSSALLEKLLIAQPLKKFSAFYGTRRFITVFTRALHRSLS